MRQFAEGCNNRRGSTGGVLYGSSNVELNQLTLLNWVYGEGDPGGTICALHGTLGNAARYSMPTAVYSLHSNLQTYSTTPNGGDISIQIANPVTGVALPGVSTPAIGINAQYDTGVAKHVTPTQHALCCAPKKYWICSGDEPLYDHG
jgi:hypothetical protein